MYRTATILFFVCFVMYILFSRQPDYFISEFTPGVTISAASLQPALQNKFNIRPGDHPVVEYSVGSEKFYFDGNDNVFFSWLEPGKKVTVIYDAGYPAVASVYSLAGYWFVCSELIVFFIAYALLFGIAVAITGKHSKEPYSTTDLERQIKYN